MSHVLFGRAHRQAQAILQQGVQAGDVLDQHAALLHAFEGPLRVGHTHQHHVGFAGEDLHAGQLASAAISRAALFAQQRGLARVFIGVFQRKEAGLRVQHAHVVGRAHLVDLIDQRCRPAQVTQAHAGQAELRHAARLGVDFFIGVGVDHVHQAEVEHRRHRQHRRQRQGAAGDDQADGDRAALGRWWFEAHRSGLSRRWRPCPAAAPPGGSRCRAPCGSAGAGNPCRSWCAGG